MNEMSKTSLLAGPDSNARRRPDSIDEQAAFLRLRINLAAYPTASPREREHLARETREIREQHQAIDEALGGPLDAGPDYTAREAAAILNLARPNGTPQDKFYDVAREQLGAYELDGRLRIRRASLEAFRRGER